VGGGAGRGGEGGGGVGGGGGGGGGGRNWLSGTPWSDVLLEERSFSARQ